MMGSLIILLGLMSFNTETRKHVGEKTGLGETLIYQKRGALKARCMIITALWRLRQEDGKFEARQNCMARNYLQIKQNKSYIQKR